MSTAEVIGMVASILVGVGGIIFAFLAWRTSQRSVQVSEEQLKLAREEAEMRPKLKVSLQEPSMTYVQTPGVHMAHRHDARLNFLIANDGRTAAHNVLCEFQFDTERLQPVDYGPFTRGRIGPTMSGGHLVNVLVRSYGPTTIHYRCVCDETGATEGDIGFEVVERHRSTPPT